MKRDIKRVVRGSTLLRGKSAWRSARCNVKQSPEPNPHCRLSPAPAQQILNQHNLTSQHALRPDSPLDTQPTLQNP